MSDIPSANEYTPPADLVNLGLKCRDCGSKKVVHKVTVINDLFPLGAYCYKCLLSRCGSTLRLGKVPGKDPYHVAIPMPMEWNLLSRLEVDLGLEKPSQTVKF